MDKQLEQQLRNAPGSIGDTARAFATSFSKIVTHKTENPTEFDKAFSKVLGYRAAAFEMHGGGEGNFLFPIHILGIRELHRQFDITDKSITGTPNKLDLPTMTFYAMLMESESFRQGFAGMPYEDIAVALKLIHQEIYKICSYQVLISEDDFSYINILRSQSFLIKIDRSLASVIGLKLNL